MIRLYWELGRTILGRQSREGWGTRVIDRLSHDLREEFPDMASLSPRNLKYMRAFAAAWPDAELVQRVVAQIPWRQNIALLEHLDEPDQRIWYAQQATARWPGLLFNKRSPLRTATEWLPKTRARVWRRWARYEPGAAALRDPHRGQPAGQRRLKDNA